MTSDHEGTTHKPSDTCFTEAVPLRARMLMRVTFPSVTSSVKPAESGRIDRVSEIIGIVQRVIENNARLVKSLPYDEQSARFSL